MEHFMYGLINLENLNLCLINFSNIYIVIVYKEINNKINII